MIHAAPRDRRCNEQPAPLRAPCVRPRHHDGECMDERARLLHEIERLVRRAVGLHLQLDLTLPEIRTLLQRVFREAMEARRWRENRRREQARLRRDP